ncbi:MAG: hypothetical protein K2V38_25300, partial [Gemmataceae bacterium]|nr:hypothetical protein [Gemmataceae bacterium]
VGAAVRGLYEECGLTVPDRVAQSLRNARGAIELFNVLTDVRLLLADQPGLRGPRALYAAMNGFRHATDPMCVLASPRANTFASIDMDFGVGLELDGVGGPAWIIYQVEYKTAQGLLPTVGWLESAPKPDALPSPVGTAWRVKRVIPESPAQKAGLRPDDLITHLNGTELTPDTADKLFRQFAFPSNRIDPKTGQAVPPDRTLTVKRDGAKPFNVKVEGVSYTPASAFGVVRTPDDKWDCLIDREHKIGYLRLGAVETGLDAKVAELTAELVKRGCRGLILDLRWCPGGYVDPAVNIAGLFLPEDAVVYRTRYRVARPVMASVERSPYDGTRHTKLPLAVLIGPDTVGGGELIAAALRDHDRCVLIGQRTFGRAVIQNLVEAGFGGLQLKVSVGESLRPNGKVRQKPLNAGPLDEWGLKPDEGLGVPVTKDKNDELRRWADLHAIRPADSKEGLDFDDPADDPARLQALEYLRKTLGKPAGK